MNKYRIYFIILVVCFAIGMKTALDTPVGTHSILFEVTSSQEGPSDLFYDIGKNFNAEHRLEAPVQADAPRSIVAYDLPQEEITKLRWDPSPNTEGVEVTLHSITMSFWGGKIVSEIDLSKAIPQNQITDFSVKDGEVHFRVLGEHNDPYLVFNEVPSLPAEPSRTILIWLGVGFSLLAAVVFSVLYRLVVWYFNS